MEDGGEDETGPRHGLRSSHVCEHDDVGRRLSAERRAAGAVGRLRRPIGRKRGLPGHTPDDRRMVSRSRRRRTNGTFQEKRTDQAHELGRFQPLVVKVQERMR